MQPSPQNNATKTEVANNRNSQKTLAMLALTNVTMH